MPLSMQSVLVTGGTGSFGKKFIQTILTEYPKVKRIVVYSRDEYKQFIMSEMPEFKGKSQLRFFIGDVRDKGRLEKAMEGIDIVVHAAALKQVPVCEYNPSEAVKTNVMGAQNVIDAALACGVSKVVALSTDKASSPINLYGATKLCSDKLFISANNMKGDRSISFSVVRYGNVMGSRGSVIPFFMEKRSDGALPVTDVEMTRFNITLEEGVRMVIHALGYAKGGEIFVPKIPSYRILDVAAAIGPDCSYPVVGIRAGEKIHEEMISVADAPNTIDAGGLYIIVPMLFGRAQQELMKDYMAHHSASRVPEGFYYSSGNNTEWLTIEQLRQLIVEHVDPEFSI